MERANTAVTGYKSKLQQIKKMIVATESPAAAAKPISLQINTCQHGKCCSGGGCRSNEVPIILEKKTPKSTRNLIKSSSEMLLTPLSPRNKFTEQRTVKRKVEEFVPIDIPDKKTISTMGEYLLPQRSSTKQIQVRIQKEDKDKDCLKKLFKKINKLTDDLNESEKQRNRLELELKNYKDLENRQRQYERRIRQLELAKHKLELDLATLRQLLNLERLKPPQILQKVVERPVEVIKQVPVEKIVEVQVEVAKLVPGPERIIQKFVEIPKYIEVEKKVPMEIIKEVIKEVPKQVVKTISVPQYIEKVVYVDKPIYVDRVVQKKVEVPIQVPIEVPVYVDRPVFEANDKGDKFGYAESDFLSKIRSLEDELRSLSRQNDSLRLQNTQLLRNLQILKKHNQDKNREVQQLIRNTHEHTHLTKGAIGGGSFRPVARSYQQVRYRF